MKGSYLLVLIVPFILSCSLKTDVKELDLKAFKISIPKTWNYIKEQGEDSFVGEFEIKKTTSLSFDCSNMGYANHLIPTEEDFLKREEWFRSECYFCKPGIEYTFKWDLKRTKTEIAKKGKMSDTSLVKVYPEFKKKIHLPTSEQKLKYPKADYIADLISKDSVIYIPIELPSEIKSHNVKIDSNDNYVYKTVWPKVTGKGITGVYIHSRKSSFNFQLSGRNLSASDQQLALNSFKTIVIQESDKK